MQLLQSSTFQDIDDSHDPKTPNGEINNQSSINKRARKANSLYSNKDYLSIDTNSDFQRACNSAEKYMTRSQTKKLKDDKKSEKAEVEKVKKKLFESFESIDSLHSTISSATNVLLDSEGPITTNPSDQRNGSFECQTNKQPHPGLSTCNQNFPEQPHSGLSTYNQNFPEQPHSGLSTYNQNFSEQPHPGLPTFHQNFSNQQPHPGLPTFNQNFYQNSGFIRPQINQQNYDGHWQNQNFFPREQFFSFQTPQFNHNHRPMVPPLTSTINGASEHSFDKRLDGLSNYDDLPTNKVTSSPMKNKNQKATENFLKIAPSINSNDKEAHPEQIISEDSEDSCEKNLTNTSHHDHSPAKDITCSPMEEDQKVDDHSNTASSMTPEGAWELKMALPQVCKYLIQFLNNKQSNLNIFMNSKNFFR